MAKETKQDRLVRTMLDQAIEHLHELKNIEANPASKESNVEVWAQSFLKNCLGYTASSGYSIRSQEVKGKMRPDLIVLKADKPVFVVEVKKLGFDLSKSDFRSGKTQLSEYLNTLGGVKYGILTNGTEWLLFDFSQPQYGGVEFAKFDLRSDCEANEVIDCSKKVVEEQCYEFLDLHEFSFSSNTWPELAKEAMAFSPESLSKAILSVDVVKYIAKSIRGEHDFKANQELLMDKVFSLLEKGLDDSIPAWNETKTLEFQKYIKSQKRASRRTKRTSFKKEAAVATEAMPVISLSPEAPIEPQCPVVAENGKTKTDVA